MEDDPYRREKFAFRIIGSPDDLTESIRCIIKKSLISEGRYFKDESIRVLSVELKEEVDYSNFISLIKSSGIERKKCGLWASLVTERDSSGIAVPDFVVDIFFQIGYALDFSFTIVS